MNKYLRFKYALLFGMSISLANLWGQVTTFSYTGAVQTYTVPIGVTSIQIEAWGAQGGTGTYGGITPNPGLGGYAIGNLDVTPGDVLNVYVGGAGASSGPGGFNGGGQAGTSYGAAGGGASDVRISAYSLSDRVIVGAGGGGAAFGSTPSDGGHGGALIGIAGENGDAFVGGGGGTQVAGGAAGCCYGAAVAGTFGLGGGPGDYHNAGGGGGWYGGGSGAGQAGAGGGSSYIGGVTDGSTTAGLRSGNGQIIISVLCTPLVVTVSAEEVCFGDEITLDAVSDFGASISWDGGVVNGVAFMPPLGSTTYTATSDADGDCGYSIEILVNDLPTVTASVDETEICLGESVLFSGSGAVDYTWDMGVTDLVLFEPLSAGTSTYTVTGADDNGCTNTATIDVTVNALPVVIANVDEADICDGNSFVFTGSGALSYTWDLGVVDGEPYTGMVGTDIYTVTGTDENGCINTASVEATVHELPVVTANASDTAVCFGTEVTFNGAGATTYTWDMGVVNDVPSAMEVSGIVTFTVIGTDDNGCMNSASIDVDVLEEIVITYTTTDEIAGGDGTINATVTGGVAPYSYDWDNDPTGDFDDTEDLSGLVGGDYVLVVMDDNGCTTAVTATVNSQLSLDEKGKLIFNVYPNPSTDQITITAEGNFSYQLVAINGDIISNGTGYNQTVLSLLELADGVYFVTLTANNTTNTVKVIKQ